jgi:hypothetical protein
LHKLRIKVIKLVKSNSASDEVLQQLPTQLDGMPVEILEVGTIKALKLLEG